MAVLPGFALLAASVLVPTEASVLTVARQGKQDATVLVLDPAASGRRSRVVARVPPPESQVSLPAGRYVAICVSKEGDGSSHLIDTAARPRQKILCRQPRAGEGVAILRTVRSPRARSLDVRRLRLKWGKDSARPALLGDVAVFSGIPRRSEVTLEPPPGSCDLTGVRFAIDGAWALREVELGSCSDLTIFASGRGGPPETGPIEITLRTFDGDPTVGGTPGRIVGTGRMTAGEPVRFASLAPADYLIEAVHRVTGSVLTDIVSVPPEAAIEHTLTMTFVRVHGRARFRQRQASGTLRFERQNGNERRRAETKIGEEGEYEAHLPDAGGYMVKLLEEGKTDGPMTGVTIPSSEDFRADLNFLNASVRGHVRDPKGKPIEKARVDVSVVGDEGDQETVWLDSDPDGGFAIESLRPGTCQIRASKPGFRAESDPTFDLADGESAVQDLVLRKTRSADVTVLTPSGQPAQGVEVFCAPPGAPLGWNLMGSTDERGSIDISIEDAGSLFCSLPNPLGAISQFTLATPEPVTWKLKDHGGQVIVIARDTNQTPVAYKTIVVRANGELIPPIPLWRHTSARGGSNILGANGSAKMGDIPAGWIEIYLSDGMNDYGGIGQAAAGSPEGRLAEFALESGDQRIVELTVRRERQ